MTYKKSAESKQSVPSVCLHLLSNHFITLKLLKTKANVLFLSYVILIVVEVTLFTASGQSKQLEILPCKCTLKGGIYILYAL